MNLSHYLIFIGNHRLGLVMEFEVEGGRLLLVMADIDAVKAYPEGEQFVKSLVDYAGSEKFRPRVRLTAAELTSLLTVPVKGTDISTLRNISYD